MFVPDGPGMEIDDETEQTLIETFQDSTEGENRGRSFALKQAMRAERLALTPQDLALDTILDRPVAEICALLRINPMVLGFNDDNRTYSNMKEAREAAWEDGMIPTQDALAEDGLQDQLLPDFGNPETETVGWDRSKVRALQESDDAKSNRTIAAWSAGLAFFNEARASLDMPPEPGADKVVMVAGQLVPLGDAIAPEEPEPAPMPSREGDDRRPFDAAKSYDPGQVRDELGRWAPTAAGRSARRKHRRKLKRRPRKPRSPEHKEMRRDHHKERRALARDIRKDRKQLRRDQARERREHEADLHEHYPTAAERNEARAGLREDQANERERERAWHFDDIESLHRRQREEEHEIVRDLTRDNRR
jgi:hypothetical protein